MASSPTAVQMLQLPQYEAFERVARLSHWDTFVHEMDIKKFIHVKADYFNMKLKNNAVCVLPSGDEEDYSKYGNLSYVMDWPSVIDRLGPNMYLLDQTINALQGHTRVLLTSNNYDKNLQKVSLATKGSPIIQIEGKFYHASSCLCKEGLGVHEAVLVVEFKRTVDAKWMFRNSVIRPNEHSLANIAFPGHTRCVRRRDIMCPFPWTVHQCRQMIKILNPQLSFTVGSVDKLASCTDPLHGKIQTATKDHQEEEEDDDEETRGGCSRRFQDMQDPSAERSSATNEVHRIGDVLDVKYLHNCVTMLTALVLVNIRVILSEEKVIQLLTFTLLVALKLYVLPALWPPKDTQTRTTEGNCGHEHVDESSDMLDGSGGNGDHFYDCDDT